MTNPGIPSTAASPPPGQPTAPTARAAEARVDAEPRQQEATTRPDAVAVETLQAVAAPGSDASVDRPAQVSAEDLAEATENISDYIQTVSRSLSISIDDTLDTPVITVKNAETEEVIRQIPSEEVLEISRFISGQVRDSSGSPDTSSQAMKAVTGLLFNDTS
jgi:flagellar protein FlaG